MFVGTKTLSTVKKANLQKAAKAAEQHVAGANTSQRTSPSEARLKLDFNHGQPSTERGELMKLMCGYAVDEMLPDFMIDLSSLRWLIGKMLVRGNRNLPGNYIITVKITRILLVILILCEEKSVLLK